MGFILPALFGLGSGIANAIASSSEASNRNQRLTNAQNLLRQSLVSEGELDRMLRSNARAFNVSLGNLLNSTALRSRGITNAPVVAAAAAAPLQGQMIQTQAGIEQSTRNANRAIYGELAQLEAGKVDSNILGDFFQGAIPGATAGIEFGKYLTWEDKLKSVGPISGTTSDTTSNVNPSQSSWLNVNNPFVDYLGYDQTRGNFPNFNRIFG